MVVGIGTGSTARFFIEGLAGRRVAVVPTSRASAELARAAGLEVLRDTHVAIDLAIDGADEIDDQLRLVKGHGGALFREKMVAMAARRFVVIADESKLVDRLGRTFVPVEVAPFLWGHTLARLARMGAGCRVRGGERSHYRTDNGNLIVDMTFAEGISDPEQTAVALKTTTGVLEHGLFLGLTCGAIIAGARGIWVLGDL